MATDDTIWFREVRARVGEHPGSEKGTLYTSTQVVFNQRGYPTMQKLVLNPEPLSAFGLGIVWTP